MKQIPFDLMPLPTKGILYQSKTDSLKVEHLIGLDEDILSSQSLIGSGKVWEELYNMKVKNKDQVGYNELFFVDKFCFMLHIRKNAYGSIYEMRFDDDSYEVDLDTIQFTEMNIQEMDEHGLFTFTLPTSKKEVKFKLLNDTQETAVREDAEKLRKAMNLKAAPEIMCKLEAQIVSLDGDKDKGKIRNYLQSPDFKPLDSLEFRKYSASLLPYTDATAEATGKRNKKKIRVRVDIGPTFFFPALSL